DMGNLYLELACVVPAADVDPDEHSTARLDVDGHLTACGLRGADHERAAHGCDLHAAGVGRGQRFEVVGQVDGGGPVVTDGGAVVVLDHGLVGLGGDMHERPVRFGGVVDDARLRAAAGEVAGGVHVRGDVEPVRGVHADVVAGNVDAVGVVRGAQREPVLADGVEPVGAGVDVDCPPAGVVGGAEADEVGRHVGAAVLGGDHDASILGGHVGVTIGDDVGVGSGPHLRLAACSQDRYARVSGRGPLDVQVRLVRLVPPGR